MLIQQGQETLETAFNGFFRHLVGADIGQAAGLAITDIFRQRFNFFIAGRYIAPAWQNRSGFFDVGRIMPTIMEHGFG